MTSSWPLTEDDVPTDWLLLIFFMGLRAASDHSQAAVKVTHLDLSWSMIKEAGVKAVARLLASPKSSLRSINVSWNSFKAGGVSLALALRGNNVLQDLELEGCNAGNALGDALAHVLANPDSALRTLNLQNTKLGTDGLAKLATALAANIRLQRLSLQHPSLGDGGAAVLGAGLARNTVLTDLTLQASGVGPKGAIALADGLASSAVVSLRLSGNRLCCSNDAGAMGERLGRLPGITQLDLQGAACASRGTTCRATDPTTAASRRHACMHAQNHLVPATHALIHHLYT